MTLKEENEKLKSKVVDLQLRIDDLMDELSKKEAEWCSKEENLVLEVQESTRNFHMKNPLVFPFQISNPSASVTCAL